MITGTNGNKKLIKRLTAHMDEDNKEWYRTRYDDEEIERRKNRGRRVDVGKKLYDWWNTWRFGWTLSDYGKMEKHHFK